MQAPEGLKMKDIQNRRTNLCRLWFDIKIQYNFYFQKCISFKTQTYKYFSTKKKEKLLLFLSTLLTSLLFEWSKNNSMNGKYRMCLIVLVGIEFSTFSCFLTEILYLPSLKFFTETWLKRILK